MFFWNTVYIVRTADALDLLQNWWKYANFIQHNETEIERSEAKRSQCLAYNFETAEKVAYRIAHRGRKV